MYIYCDLSHVEEESSKLYFMTFNTYDKDVERTNDVKLMNGRIRRRKIQNCRLYMWCRKRKKVCHIPALCSTPGWRRKFPI